VTIRFHSHAIARMKERGVSQEEAVAAIEHGEQFSGKYGRTGFRRNFLYDEDWRGRHYNIKQVEVYTVRDGDDCLVITVISKYF